MDPSEDSVAAGSQRSSTAWATGLSVTGGAVLFMILRLLAVSNYDWRHAFLVAGTIDIGDAPAVVAGTLMADPAITGVALALIVPVMVIHQIHLGRPTSGNSGNLAMVIIVVVATLALVWTYRTWWILLGAVVVAAALLVLLGAGRRNARGQRFAHWILHRTGAVMILATLLVAAAVRVPWMPLEHIDTRTGAVSGYVLETAPGFVKILREEDRDIMIVNTGDIVSRHEIPPSL
ncbi:hypothetical protein BJY24_000820 [Nocardia transvalensis]|uniref:Uncharacterized protein n=1 Tax=Nocardia transvalensis TaxID=37333 RepID=A0A7W9PA27_9NOCA|nr:hypothetical protein [Nocardia transvalensis]MBB5911953.1 hypothetical protein [Nocardia transvalensis]